MDSMCSNDATFERLRSHISAIAPISNDEFARLIGFFTPIRLKKKELFYMQGELCRYVAFVNEGCLRTFHTDSKGDEFTMYFAFPEWWIGDPESFYAGTPARFSCQALEECGLLRADKEHFEGALDQVPPFETFYRHKMQASYAAAQQKLIQAHSESAEEKYRRLVETAPDIVQRIPQVHIASYLGIRPQSLSRIRKNISRSR
jgi:CRP/FNR family transcriptional regulator, anaerobic regulatory protein